MNIHFKGFILLLPAFLITVGALGVATVATAQIVLPGNPLYGIKTTTNTMRLAVAVTEEQKAKTHLSIAAVKIDELERLHKNNSSSDILAKVEEQIEQNQIRAQEKISFTKDDKKRDGLVHRINLNAAKNNKILSDIKQKNTEGQK